MNGRHRCQKRRLTRLAQELIQGSTSLLGSRRSRSYSVGMPPIETSGQEARRSNVIRATLARGRRRRATSFTLGILRPRHRARHGLRCQVYLGESRARACAATRSQREGVVPIF